jgi:hypothetical protein
MMAAVSRKPDVAERFDNHPGEGSNAARLRGSGLIGSDQPHIFALAIGMNRGGKGGNLGLRGRQIFQPEVGGAGEADPDGLVGSPFGERKLTHVARR